MKILITGGAGFIGSHLADSLLKAGHHVRVLDSLDSQVHRDQSGPPSYLSRDVEFQKGDVRSRSDVEKALNGIEAVYHYAAAVGVGQSMYRIHHYMDVNTVGTSCLLEEMVSRRSQFCKLTVASSMSIYGEGMYRKSNGECFSPPLRKVDQLANGLWEHLDPGTGEPLKAVPTDETKPLSPASPYASGKRDQEELCLQIGRAYDIPTVALRFFNVYGDRQSLSNPYTGLAAIIISRLKNGNAPLIFEDGKQTRDFTHVSDIVSASMLALQFDQMVNGAFNVGSGRALSVLDAAAAITNAMGLDIQPEITYKFREGDIRHCFANIEKLSLASGYAPKVEFENGVAELVEWSNRVGADDQVDKAASELSLRGLTR